MTAPAALPTDEYTWVALIPPDDQEADPDQWITRENLLAWINALYVEPVVNERVLKSWEAKGILPRPLVRWKDGRPHAWYPPELGPLSIQFLLRLKHDGHSLGQIKLFMEDHIAAHLKYGKRKDPTPRDLWSQALQRVADQFRSLDETYHGVTGRQIKTIDVKVTDDAGESFTMTFPDYTWWWTEGASSV